MLKKPSVSIISGLFVFLILCGNLSQDVLLAAEELRNSPASTQTIELIKPENISVDFKDADMQNVLRILAMKGNVNIVAASDVAGTVTVKLTDVPWETALDVILKTHDYGYERQGNIITVTGMERLTSQKEAEKRLSEIQPVLTEVFSLKYLDAEDVSETIKPQLSPRGTITVLKMTSDAGWQFSGGAKGESLKKLERAAEGKAKAVRSKTLIISDIPAYVDKIKKVLEKLDIPPQQILIEARIMEVNENKLKDLGFEWGTGSTGAENTAITTTPAMKNSDGETLEAAGGHILNTQVTPSIFSPQATGLTAANTGLAFLFQRLKGTQFEVMLHALEEDVDTNTLSAPRIMTLNNQEATILVGTKYPILKSDISTQAGTTVTSTLDYYQDIGIQLNVVPQISGDNKFINMVIHPAVTSFDSSNTVGTNKYPVISTREAETRVLIENNQTVAIGGLLKDVKKKGNIGVPFLKDIPLLGVFFKRDTNTVEKVDLLIFITARIVRPEEYRSEESVEDLTAYYQLEQEMVHEKMDAKKNKNKDKNHKRR